MCVGFSSSIWSTVTLSLRKTRISRPADHLAQLLDQVVGERIVIVDQHKHTREQKGKESRGKKEGIANVEYK